MNSDKSVTVITPTIGSADLVDAIISVKNQDYDGPIDHLVVVDGQQFAPEVERIIEKSGVNPTVLVLPYNTGSDGWNGHRIYASIPSLVNTKYVAFLDQDNWYKPNHVSSLVEILEKNDNIELAFSLRSIYEKDKTYVTDDNCESLGLWPVWNSGNSNFLIDTNSFLFKTDFIQKTGSSWLKKYNADAYYTKFLRANFLNKYATSGLYTSCYRLDGNKNSVKKEFFLLGNFFFSNVYKNKNFPWANIKESKQRQ